MCEHFDQALCENEKFCQWQKPSEQCVCSSAQFVGDKCEKDVNEWMDIPACDSGSANKTVCVGVAFAAAVDRYHRSCEEFPACQGWYIVKDFVSKLSMFIFIRCIKDALEVVVVAIFVSEVVREVRRRDLDELWSRTRRAYVFIALFCLTGVVLEAVILYYASGSTPFVESIKAANCVQRGPQTDIMVDLFYWIRSMASGSKAKLAVMCVAFGAAVNSWCFSDRDSATFDVLKKFAGCTSVMLTLGNIFYGFYQLTFVTAQYVANIQDVERNIIFSTQLPNGGGMCLHRTKDLPVDAITGVHAMDPKICLVVTAICIVVFAILLKGYSYFRETSVVDVLYGIRRTIPNPRGSMGGMELRRSP